MTETPRKMPTQTRRRREAASPTTRDPEALSTFVLPGGFEYRLLLEEELAAAPHLTDGLLRRLHVRHDEKGLGRASLSLHQRCIRQLVSTVIQVEGADFASQMRMRDLSRTHLATAESQARAQTVGDPESAAVRFRGRMHLMLQVTIQDDPLSLVLQAAVDHFSGSFVLGGKPLKAKNPPLEPLLPDQVGALRVAALRTIDATLAKHRVGLGSELDEVVDFYRTQGPVGDTRIPKRLRRLIRENGLVPGDVKSFVYPTAYELLPFFLLLIMETGLETEAARGLTRSALSHESNGHADLNYTKLRAGADSAKSIRVLDSGHGSPGWLIRQVLKLTEDSHRVSSLESLWTAWHMHGSRPVYERTGIHPQLYRARFRRVWRNGGRDIVDDFVDRACADAGIETFRLSDFRRLRKSSKSESYIAARGNLTTFVRGHSSQIAVSHYSQLEAHRDLHEAAIEDGLTDAFKSALARPTVAANDHDLERVVTDEAVLRAVQRGELDMHTNDCLDFHHSPFGPAGSACPVPFWGCLNCGNAVIREGHLPSILKFHDHAVEQIEGMSLEDWRDRFAPTLATIRHHVLPRFTKKQLDAARKSVNAGKARIYLPLTPATPEVVE